VIARVGIGLAVRANDAAPDISTPDALRQALLRADSLVFNTVASGNHFAIVLDRLGIGAAVKSKVVRTAPGGGTFARVLQGAGHDIGISPITLIKARKDLKLVGPLPAELQSYLLYAAAPMTNAQTPDVANEFIGFLASPVAKSHFLASGAE
jgi:molybdate transport system substrate-binding protein